MIQSSINTLDNKLALMNSSQMELDYLAAKAEIKRTLGFNIGISSAGRTEQENKEIEAKYGYSGGHQHVEGTALDILVSGIKAFKPGGHTPTEEGLKYAQAIQGIMAKHGFKWAGEKDIVHFSYNTNISSVVTAHIPEQAKSDNIVELFFSKFDVLDNSLSKINTLPEKRFKEMAKFLIAAGKHK